MASRLIFSIGFGLLMLATAAHAVEPGSVKVGDRWSVVGIISGDDDKGIAVIRNNATKRTYTLAIGDAVPTEFGFVLKSVRNRTVVIADAAETIQLSFSEPSSDEVETVSQTRRFIDNYYRSLGETPPEGGIGTAEAASDVGVAPRDDVDFVPIPRFGDGEGAGRSRFELYRAERDAAGEPAVSFDENGEPTAYEFDDESAAGQAEDVGGYEGPGDVEDVTE